LEDFISSVAKDIPSPFLDKSSRCRRVDPVILGAPPQLPLSEAFGLMQSLCQALDPSRPSIQQSDEQFYTATDVVARRD
jgi:hypothetical protein